MSERRQGPPPRGVMVPGAAKGAGKSFVRLLSYMKRYWMQLILVFVCILVSAVAGVAGSTFLQTLIDDYISPMLLNGSRDFSGLAGALAKLGVLYAAGILGTLFYNRLMVVVAQGILKTIRDEMFSHMQTLPIRFFDTHASGDVMSLYTNDTDTLRQMLAQSIPQIFSSIVTVIAVFVAMVRLSIWLTLFVLAFVALMMLVTKFVGGKSGAFFVKQQNSIGAVNGYIEEMIHGQKVIKVFCHEEQTKADFDKHNDELFQNAAWANSFANILMPIMNNLGYVQYVLLAMLGGALAFHGVGGLTLGAIAAFLQLSRSFTMPISQISQQASAIVMALAGAGRIFELLDEEPETDEGYVTLVNAEEQDGVLTETDHRTGVWAWKHPHGDGTVTYTRMAGDVQFFDVDFGYVPEKIVLHDVSLYAKPGEKVAFVGATGAGKTTMVDLILGVLKPQAGKITVDGMDIKESYRGWHDKIGYIPQTIYMLDDTIRNNIAFGKVKSIDDAEIWAALKQAQLDEFVKSLDEGLDTMIGEAGVRLSGGQRQRIGIARALYRRPEVLVLDEATSALDTETEAAVMEAIDSLQGKMTMLIIAHRLSTIKNCDMVYQVEGGSVTRKEKESV